ncbi:hypothetical protein QTP88_029178 [Uroleucon formosanum]
MSKSIFFKPEFYSGEPDECVIDFIENYNLISAANEWSDDKKIMYAPIYLKKSAKAFYQNYIISNPTPSWSHFELALKEYFMSPGRARMLKAKLTNRKLKLNETVSQFLADFQLLAHKNGHSLDNQKDQNLKHGNNKNGNKATEYLLRIVQLNVEGMTKSKAELISDVFHHADILALQETHISDDQLGKLKIPGYIGHNKHGMATFVSQDLDPKNIRRLEGNKHTVGIEIGNTNIFNIYKPPSEKWTTSVLPLAEHPAVYIGDFNSHNMEWGYNSTDNNGETLSNWAQLNHLQLLYDAKQGGTFKSGRWGSITSPDLCFVTTDSSNMPLKANRQILQEFPRSQHLSKWISV